MLQILSSRFRLLRIFLLTCFSLPTLALADDEEDFDRLMHQVHQEKRAAKYAEMEKTALRLCGLAEGPLKNDPKRLPDAVFQLALAYDMQGQYAKAAETYQRTVALYEKIYGAESEAVANALNNLGRVYADLCRYVEAEQCHKRALAILEKLFGAEHEHVATSLSNLASLARAQGHYDKAETFYKQTLAMREKVLGRSDWRVGMTLQQLGECYELQGRYDEAEAMRKRGIEIAEKGKGSHKAFLGEHLNNLTIHYYIRGRFADAIPLCYKALRVSEEESGSESLAVAQNLSTLGYIYLVQGRFGFAENYLKRALAIQEKALGTEHPKVAETLGHLGRLSYDEAEQGMKPYAAAEPLFRRSIAIYEKAFGREHPKVCGILWQSAMVTKQLGRHEEAEAFLLRSLEITKKHMGPEHHENAFILHSLGLLYKDMGRYEEAIVSVDQSIRIYERLGVTPQNLSQAYRCRAEVLWQMGRREAAIADLQKSMERIEQGRANVAGGDIERSRQFFVNSGPFHLMMKWQMEMGNLAEVLAAMERARGRVLLDQMEVQGKGLLEGVPEELAEPLRRRQYQAQEHVAVVEAQLRALGRRQDIGPGDREKERKRLEGDLDDARFHCFDAFRDIQDASPAYRLVAAKQRSPVSLDVLQRWVRRRRALLLEYLASWDGGYVLIVPADGKVRLEKLVIDAAHAKVLGVDAGPLTDERLSAALSNEKGTGVLDQLRKTDTPEAVQKVVPALAVLWEVLIPKEEREAIQAGKYRRLIVLPDGSMAKLPFETLVVRTGDRPEYLLDIGPAIEYAPSARILMNLAERQEQSGMKDLKDREPVLTVGDCRYGQAAQLDEKNLLAQLAPRARYGSVGGQLSPLPYSATEIRWVADVFGEKGTKVAWLKGDIATEAAVRFNAPGRRVLHFACHGLVDESYGNLFGALALTPGPNPDDPADDGFLTLAEVYGMNLKGCELAILSACDTNVGPQQRGEGIWALSRGFLVAGSRRVVASNWLVDDEAAPSFVSYFTSIIAKAEKEGKTPDYAQAVHDAKLFLRHHQNKKWHNPYYWGTFVLIGPN